MIQSSFNQLCFLNLGIVKRKISGNGNYYEGKFKDGLKNGEGIYYHNNTGQVQKGVWIEDICKVSVMQDNETRSQIALKPTPYPIPEVMID